MEHKDKEDISLKTIIVKYLHHWKLFLVVFILSFIPAILYLKIFPRTYEFAASILLQEEEDSPLSGLGLGEAGGLLKSFGIGGNTGSLNVDDEMEILASNRLQRMLVLELGLNVSYAEPFSLYKMYHEAPLRLTCDASTMARLDEEYRFKVSVTPGEIKVKVTSYPGGFRGVYTCASLPTVIKAGSDEFMLDFDNDGAQKGSFKLNIRVSPASWTAEKLSKNIEIEDVSSSSNVLTLLCSEHSKQRGLDMLNSLISLYNRDMKAYQNSEDYKTVARVNERIAEVVSELVKVEVKIDSFKTKNDMTLLEADVTLYGEIFKDIQASIIETEVQLWQFDLVDQHVKNPENRNKAIPSILSVSDGEKGAVSEYNKAITEQERILSTSNEDNYTYKLLKNKTDILREGVITTIENAQISMNKALDELKTKENQLVSKMKAIPGKEREYINLARDQEIFQGIYLMLLQKREEALMSIDKQLDRARVIEPPFIKKKPLGPRKLFAGIGILVLTIIVPIGYLFAKDLLISIKEEYNSTKN